MIQVITEIISFDGGSINDDTDDNLDHQGKFSVAPLVIGFSGHLVRKKGLSKKSFRAGEMFMSWRFLKQKNSGKCSRRLKKNFRKKNYSKIYFIINR